MRLQKRRSREGAWIEILKAAVHLSIMVVAPVRERGLKLKYSMYISDCKCRSREGAWIEMHPAGDSQSAHRVAPVRERGLK